MNKKASYTFAKGKIIWKRLDDGRCSSESDGEWYMLIKSEGGETNKRENAGLKVNSENGWQ